MNALTSCPYCGGRIFTFRFNPLVLTDDERVYRLPGDSSWLCGNCGNTGGAVVRHSVEIAWATAYAAVRHRRAIARTVLMFGLDQFKAWARGGTDEVSRRVASRLEYFLGSKEETVVVSSNWRSHERRA